ncbi:MAG: NAD(P)/FAD-dependent oxidoreductase [Streptosporangiaceae bacterium]
MRSQPAGAAAVVIIGGGFGGLAALNALAGTGISVTLVDRNVYSTFQPLLYQVATAGLTSSDVAYPLWAAARKAGARFRKGELAGIDEAAASVLLADGGKLRYDYLILATGVAAAFFGVPGAAEHSMSLYTRKDAVRLRDRLMTELEQRSTRQSGGDLAITVVGGGATGVELAGTLAELRNIALPASFPEVDPSAVHVRLIEQGDALIAPFQPGLREYARQQLIDRGVEVRLGAAIKEVSAGRVLLGDGTSLRSDVTVWAAGVTAPADAGPALPRGRGGRYAVGQDLRVEGQDRIFAVGDVAVQGDDPVAQLAQPAIQEGRHAAGQIRRLMAGQPTIPFRYHDKGTMATIGHRSAVVQLPRGIRLRGTLAWLVWLALHLVTLLGNRNRLSALVNLSWRYLTWSRGGGLIIGDEESPPAQQPAR